MVGSVLIIDFDSDDAAAYFALPTLRPSGVISGRYDNAMAENAT